MSDTPTIDLVPHNGAILWKWIAASILMVSFSVLSTGYASWHSFGGGVTAAAVKEITKAQVDPVKQHNATQDQTMKQMREWLLRLSESQRANREQMIDRLGRIETILERLESRP